MFAALLLAARSSSSRSSQGSLPGFRVPGDRVSIASRRQWVDAPEGVRGNLVIVVPARELINRLLESSLVVHANGWLTPQERPRRQWFFHDGALKANKRLLFYGGVGRVGQRCRARTAGSSS